MPQWHEPPVKVLGNALDDALDLLNEQIAGSPPFEDVMGFPVEDLTNHAMQAISVLIRGGAVTGPEPNSMIHIYCLGFMIGCKYTEQKAQKNGDESHG